MRINRKRNVVRESRIDDCFKNDVQILAEILVNICDGSCLTNGLQDGVCVRVFSF